MGRCRSGNRGVVVLGAAWRAELALGAVTEHGSADATGAVSTGTTADSAVADTTARDASRRGAGMSHLSSVTPVTIVTDEVGGRAPCGTDTDP
jgi:hypothetical protein